MEIWIDVFGYEGVYQVSNIGTVRNSKTLNVLKPASHKFGYSRVNLCKEGGYKTRLIHHLVAEAFIGERPKGMFVCHNDGNPKNNRVENLRYATQAENLADRIAHGTSNRGERHGLSKLSDEQHREILEELLKDGCVQRRIAERYRISCSLVTMIKKGKVRCHV